MQYTSPDGAKKWQNNRIHTPFTNLFNVHGYLQRKELHKFLARNIEVVGLADPAAAKAPLMGEQEADGKAAASTQRDTIEVASPGAGAGNAEGLSTARNTRARSKSPLPEGVGENASRDATPVKRGPGRPKKKA